jgi:hypothetical protein
MTDIPTIKIRMLNNSLRCFVFGFLGLFPLIGLPFAFLALLFSGKARVDEKHYWNAARPYRIGGIVMAAVGPIFWFLVLALIIYNSVSNTDQGNSF